jgi:protocatechuate 3,4-dioxygenase beta subunit
MKRMLLCFGTIVVLANGVIAQIQGDIVDRKGKVVPNVTLTATDENGVAVATVKSDEQGYYGFVGLKPGTYKIVAKATGFRPAVYKNNVVKKGDTGLIEEGDIYKGITVDITLSTDLIPYQIEGQVIDQKEKGMPNIPITVMDTSGKVMATVRSDNLGFYGFKDLRPGKYRIAGKTPGFRPVVYNVVVNEVEGEDDKYLATWVYIVLTPVKNPK